MVHSVFPQRVFRYNRPQLSMLDWLSLHSGCLAAMSLHAQYLGYRRKLLPGAVQRHDRCATDMNMWLAVCRVNTSGVAVQQFVTTSPKLFEPYKDEDIHGGPPLIHMPAHLSSLGRDYLLGVFHFFKVQ